MITGNAADGAMNANAVCISMIPVSPNLMILGMMKMPDCLDCVWSVAVWDKNGNLTSYRCTQPKCENGEYYEEEDDGRETDLYGDEF